MPVTPGPEIRSPVPRSLPVLLVMALLLCAWLTACSESSTNAGSVPDTVVATLSTSDPSGPATVGHTIVLEATVEGAVATKVDFLLSGEPIGTDANEPFSLPYELETPGSHRFEALAETDVGTVRSEPLAIEVGAAEPLPDERIRMALEPASAVLVTGGSATFRLAEGVAQGPFEWEADGGTIEASGETALYRAPSTPGRYTLTVRSVNEPLSSASAEITVTAGVAEGFTLIAIPDTQNMIKDDVYHVLFDAMTEWIVEAREELNVRFVTHEGDVVDKGDSTLEWQRADRAMGLLDGLLPYSVALGDHEYAIEENMGTSTAGYLATFGPERYAEYDWYLGSSPDGHNHAQLFEAGGRRFLHIALEWEAPGPVDDPTSPLGWARGVLEAYPDTPTIITTHAYLWDLPDYEGRTWREHHLEGYIEEDGQTIYPGTTGQGIFEALVQPYPQVFMVLSGHYHKVPGRGEDTNDGEYHQVSLNDAGLPVYEMLANYQDYLPTGGAGYLRIIRFLPGEGEEAPDRIAVETYSPWLDDNPDASDLPAYQTDPRSEFHFDLDFAERFSLGD